MIPDNQASGFCNCDAAIEGTYIRSGFMGSGIFLCRFCVNVGLVGQFNPEATAAEGFGFDADPAPQSVDSFFGDGETHTCSAGLRSGFLESLEGLEYCF